MVPLEKGAMVEVPMKAKLLVLFLLAMLFASRATAGVTIHYEGMAVSPDAVARILAAVTSVAKHHGWSVEDASAKRGRLQRVIDEKDKDYEGPVTGVVIRVSENCEPLYFQFGDDLFMQDFVKTQFAGAGVHIQIVQLLESIKPFFRKLVVDDEGEFWASHDRARLEGNIEKINRVLEEIKQKDPKARGPVTLQSGRIVDVIQ